MPIVIMYYLTVSDVLFEELADCRYLQIFEDISPKIQEAVYNQVLILGLDIMWNFGQEKNEGKKMKLNHKIMDR